MFDERRSTSRRAVLKGSAALGAAALVLLTGVGQAAWPQGFAGLGGGGEGFAQVEPDPSFEFPRDFAAHPEFRIEWWYVTANLTGPDGAPMGLQWTLFRQVRAPEAGPAGAGEMVDVLPLP